MDRISKERRSWNMSRIRSKDTKPEKMLRSRLHMQGYRFRLHHKDLPGKPDIVFPKYKIVVFVHGCFWHGHNCSFAHTSKSNKVFWQNKIQINKKRDKKRVRQIKNIGWNSVTVWECQVHKGLDKVISKVKNYLWDKSARHF